MEHDKIDVQTFSDIEYSLKIMDTIMLESEESKQYTFDPVNGKIIEV